jgi:hypothetical protein
MQFLEHQILLVATILDLLAKATRVEIADCRLASSRFKIEEHLQPTREVGPGMQIRVQPL